MTLFTIIFSFIPALVLAIGVHEFGHAFSAYLLGDPTPKEQGRVSLNPIVHLDPMGIMLPFFLALSGIPMMFGWGKPVLIQYANLKKPIRDEALIAVAGPLMNILMCVVMALLWKPVYEYFWYGTIFGFSVASPAMDSFIQWASNFIKTCLNINVGLFLFNLLPIPPLDGSKILFNLFGKMGKAIFFKIEPFGFFILIFVLFSRVLNTVLYPPYLMLMNLFIKI
ncbi:site-2 protease family protein [Candidatus Riflebacteria bacterium]